MFYDIKADAYKMGLRATEWTSSTDECGFVLSAYQPVGDYWTKSSLAVKSGWLMLHQKGRWLPWYGNALTPPKERSSKQLTLWTKLWLQTSRIPEMSCWTSFPEVRKSLLLVTATCCCYLLLAGMRWNISSLLAAGSSICLTYACCCTCSPDFLMMDSKTIENTQSFLQE